MSSRTSRVAASETVVVPGVGTSLAPQLDSQLDTQPSRSLSLAWLFRRLGSRHATWLIIGVGLLLTSTSLTLGLTGDDHLHALMLRDQPGIEGLPHRALDLFAFAKGKPAETHGLVQEGLFPWWTNPQVVIAFFRPLSSATHWLDHELWPNKPVLMHLHSMVWLLLLLLAAARVYKRFFASAWLAGLALLLYAVDDARAAPVAWIANRNAMVAAVPPLLALLAHDRARREGHRLSLLLAPLWLAVGLLAGEAAVQMVGYLIAYAVYIDTGSRKQRLWSLAPYLALVVAWRALYVVLGYGAHGSGLYLDPAAHPLAFAASLVTRLPVLLLAEFALPWSEFWDIAPVLAPWGQPAMLVLAALVLSVLTVLVRPLWRRDPSVRFWALGTLLATVPACAAVPNDRLLTATGIGGAALLARFLGSLVDSSYAGSYAQQSRAVHLFGEGLLFIHLVFSPFALPFRTKAVDGLELLVARADRSIPSTPDIAQREVVVLNPPVDPVAVYFAVYRQVHGIPRPKYFRWLSTGVSELTVQRRDEHTLRLRPTGGFLSNSAQWMLRDPKVPSHVGETVELSDATFVVTALTADGRPAEVDVRFRDPLESPHLKWMQWGVHEYVDFRPPPIGETVVIPRVDLQKAVFGLGLSDT